MAPEDESSVRVALRIRPQLPREVLDMCRVCTTVTPHEPQVTLGTDKAFTFDYVFDTEVDQVEIYEATTKTLVQGTLEGYNATVLAYGQTGSGKTYTMGTGFDVDLHSEQVGIIPRAIHELFDGISRITNEAQDRGEPPPQFKVSAQFLELYNEEIIDLFDAAREYTKGKGSIKIHEDANHCIYLTGVRSERVGTPEEALEWLRQGALARTTGSTRMNAQSSRSHAIFTLQIKQQRVVQMECSEGETNGETDFETLTAKFHFVDLAGSERLKRTGATGDRAKEGISINCGLLALGNVISALGDQSKRALHVPYRDSKLTRLLQDSLGGNSRTLMIACVSPSDSDFMETLNTLNYANRARNIQNKVFINQDKSSRTISILKKEIQQLQLELLEYKQGKRVIGEDGVESVNDMFHENTLLQNEVDNLRTRVKAMQETIESLSAKNTELLADRAIASWINQDGDNKNDDLSQMIKGYLSEIEELRAKLFESEAICAQLRKSMARNKAMFSPRNMDDDEDADDIIEIAKRDLKKDLESLSPVKKSMASDDSEDESNSTESESEDESAEDNNNMQQDEYSKELATLTSEISVKQKLIDALEKAQSRLNNMKQHYEDKLLQLQNKIVATQQERDSVLASLSLGSNMQPNSEKIKQIKDDYEKRLSNMKRDMKSLQKAKLDHAKLLRDQGQYQSQVKTLGSEIQEMKRAKVKLINKMKEEASKHKEAEVRRNREIAQLKKMRRQDQNLIKNLEAEKRAKTIVLKRKTEEVTALRRIASSRDKLKANARKDKGIGVSPKKPKRAWIKLEKAISECTMNKQSMMALEKEMEKKLSARAELQEELKAKVTLLSDPLMKSSYLEEEVENLRLSLDHVQASIADLRTEILQVEENKVTYETGDLIRSIGDMSDAAYFLDKLYNMALHQSFLAAQKESSVRELEAENEQLKRNSEVQEQLLQHLVENKGVKTPQEQSASESSSRSVSPVDNGRASRHETNRSRMKTMGRQDLLFASNDSNNVERQSQSAATSPEHHSSIPPLTRSLTTIKVQSVPASPVTLRKGLTLSPRINRKTYIISSNHPSIERGGDGSPPNSPPVYRRQTSREENVFSRLASTPAQTLRHPGKITPMIANNRRGEKHGLLCTHIISNGHTKAVLALTATDDNLFTASRDRTVVMWDLGEYRESQVFSNHSHEVVAVKYDPVNRLLFSAFSTYIKVWDVRSNKQVKVLGSSGTLNNWLGPASNNSDNSVNDIALNHDCNTLFMAAGDRVRIWDLRKFSVIGKLSGEHRAAVMCLAVSSTTGSQDLVITGSKDHYIKVCRVSRAYTGISSPSVTLEPPHYDGIQCLALHGNTLFSGSRDSIIKKWDLTSHTLVMSVNAAHKDWVTGLTFTPGLSSLVSASRSGYMKLWSLDDCTALDEIRAHRAPVNAITSNSNHVFSASSTGEVKMWKEPVEASESTDLMSMSTGQVFQLSV